MALNFKILGDTYTKVKDIIWLHLVPRGYEIFYRFRWDVYQNRRVNSFATYLN